MCGIITILHELSYLQLEVVEVVEVVELVEVECRRGHWLTGWTLTEEITTGQYQTGRWCLWRASGQLLFFAMLHTSDCPMLHTSAVRRTVGPSVRPTKPIKIKTVNSLKHWNIRFWQPLGSLFLIFRENNILFAVPHYLLDEMSLCMSPGLP